MPNIKTITERKRGCGFRHAGGFYFRSEERAKVCGMLPVPFIACEYCDCIPQQSRGFQWMTGKYFQYIVSGNTCRREEEASNPCGSCNFINVVFDVKRIALDWVGSSHYKTTEQFTREADEMGISRRLPVKIDTEGNIKTVGLKDFQIGKDWIALAHKKAALAIPENGHIEIAVPGIFTIYRPRCIEYIVKGNESIEFLEKLESQGVELVKIVPASELKTLF